MKNMIPITCLFMLGLFLIFHKKPKIIDQPVGASHSRQIATVPLHQVPVKKSNRLYNTQSLQASLVKKNFITQDKTVLSRSLPQKDLSVKTPRVPIPSLQKNKVELSSLQVPTAKDIELLQAVAERSRQQGSKIAYIGELPALYAFEPRFFYQQADASGQTSWQLQGVNDSSAGFLVQREPYPVPAGGINDYALLSKVIIRAATDGASLINITAPKTAALDRSRLKEAIQYAHGRGVPVIAAGTTPSW